ncbi:hypothetical protein GCM10008969_21790 [Pseudomonas veronii subsp. inensis]
MANNAPSGDGSTALIPRAIAQIASNNTANNRIPFIDPPPLLLEAGSVASLCAFEKSPVFAFGNIGETYRFKKGRRYNHRIGTCAHYVWRV